ncbi:MULTISPECIES: hypothetical protein [unclassified Streptomyces]|nr:MULTISPECIES: hypothetical protein [unclassified Streptomyces]MCX4409979.1 hypothetical protein [Streptomyces sp. NBC_01764]MCX5191750.1 hypothetical protein [Streptomyces sp. NBC_00268]
MAARRLVTGTFVDQVTRLSRLSRLGHLNLGCTTWELTGWDHGSGR